MLLSPRLQCILRSLAGTLYQEQHEHTVSECTTVPVSHPCDLHDLCRY